MEFKRHRFIGTGRTCARKGCGRIALANVHTVGEPRRG